MSEEWKEICGSKGHYFVSNLGAVKSVDREVTMIQYGKVVVKKFKGRTLIPCVHRDGYTKAGIHGKYLFIHRIVAMAFIPNPEGKATVNHINGVKNDNRSCNLEWATYSENTLHSFKSGLSTINSYQIKILVDRVRGNNYTGKLVIDKETGIFFLSASEAARCINIEPGTMVARIRKFKNYRFCYA